MALRHWVKLRKDHYKAKIIPHSEIWTTQYRTDFRVNYDENKGMGVELIGNCSSKKEAHAFLMDYIRSHEY